MEFTSVKKPHLLASYKIGYRIAKAMKSHTLAEEVIKPCAVDMADIILGEMVLPGSRNKLRCPMILFVEESMISVLIFAIN